MQVDSSCSCPLSRERGPDSFGRYVFRVRDSTLVASTYYYFRRTRAVPLVWAAGGRPPGDRRATAGLNPAAVWPSAQRPPARARMRLAIFAVLADRPAAAYAAGRRATAGLNPAAVWPSAQRPPARARMWVAIFAVLADRPAAAYAGGRPPGDRRAEPRGCMAFGPAPASAGAHVARHIRGAGRSPSRRVRGRAPGDRRAEPRGCMAFGPAPASASAHVGAVPRRVPTFRSVEGDGGSRTGIRARLEAGQRLRDSRSLRWRAVHQQFGSLVGSNQRHSGRPDGADQRDAGRAEDEEGRGERVAFGGGFGGDGGGHGAGLRRAGARVEDVAIAPAAVLEGFVVRRGDGKRPVTQGNGSDCVVFAAVRAADRDGPGLLAGRRAEGVDRAGPAMQQRRVDFELLAQQLDRALDGIALADCAELQLHARPIEADRLLIRVQIDVAHADDRACGLDLAP